LALLLVTLGCAAVSTTSVGNLADSLSTDLVDYGSRVLATTAMETHLAQYSSAATFPDGSALILDLAQRVAAVISARAQLAIDIKDIVELFTTPGHFLSAPGDDPQAVECCLAAPTVFSELFGKFVDNAATCNRYPSGFDPTESETEMKIANAIQERMVNLRASSGEFLYQ
jgi:hypothetical protein